MAEINFKYHDSGSDLAHAMLMGVAAMERGERLRLALAILMSECDDQGGELQMSVGTSEGRYDLELSKVD